MSRSKRARRRASTASPEPTRRPARIANATRSIDRLLAFGAILAAALIAYHNCFQNAFVFDDIQRIQQNPFIRGFSLDVLANTSRPLVQLSLALNHAVSGLEVWSYHAFNVGVHVLAAFALFAVVRATLSQPRIPERFRTAANGLALSATLLWVVHPVQTQAVSYLIQRSEAMASLFYLLTLYTAMRAFDSDHPRRWWIASIACCALGMMSKPMMATAPLMVLVYDRVFRGDSWRALWRQRSVLYLGLFATLTLLPVLLARAPMDWRYSSGFATPGVGAADYAATQPGVILQYLKQALWPHPLIFDYAWPVANGVAAILLPAIVVALLAGVSLFALLRGHLLGFLGIWFFIILAPTSSFVPVLDLAVEHRLYLPLAAVAMLMVVAGFEIVRRVGGRRTVAVALTLALVVTLGALTIRRNRDYASAQILWSDTVAKRPSNLRARINLGFALDEAGQRDQGLAQFQAVLDQDADFAWARVAMGQTLEKLGQREDALVHLREAVRLMPASAEARYQLGTVLFRQRATEEAIIHLEEAVRLEPGRADAYNNLGAAHERNQNDASAAAAFTAAVRLNPESAMLRCNLGFALGRLGQLEDSRQQFLAALQLEPGNTRALGALDELQRALERNTP